MNEAGVEGRYGTSKAWHCRGSESFCVAGHLRVCLEEAATQQGFEGQAFVDGLKSVIFLSSFIVWFIAIRNLKTVTWRRKLSSSVWELFWGKYQTKLLVIKHSRCLQTCSHTEPDRGREWHQENKTRTLPRSGRIKRKGFHLAVAPRKAGDISDDQEAKRRRLKRLEKTVTLKGQIGTKKYVQSDLQTGFQRPGWEMLCGTVLGDEWLEAARWVVSPPPNTHLHVAAQLSRSWVPLGYYFLSHSTFFLT